MGFLLRRVGLLIILAGICLEARAGEISGLPSQTVPTIDADLSIDFSNDFLGRGGSIDDFRTTQLIVSARIGDKWIALVDHSTLTLETPLLNGRVDQLSASLGYRFIDRQSPDRVSRVSAGSGFRAAGDYSGEPMQNGFHRIIGSDVTRLPYVSTNSVDLTLWFDADFYRAFHTSSGAGFFGNWKSAYWIRANSLITSDSQWDGSLGAYAVTSRNSIDLWVGARRDWRTGYDQDFVQNATAAAEDDIALVVGLRWGALILETVQQLNNDASYGQLKLISTGKYPFPTTGSVPRFNVEFGFIVPDVQLQLAGKFRSNMLVSPTSGWRESIVLDTRLGEPQYKNDPDLYVQTRQLSVAMEWERSLPETLNWISGYGALGVGWRSEKLLGDGSLSGETSESVGKATAIYGTGLRFAAADLGGGWTYRLQLGVSGWIPVSSSRVQFAGQSMQLHKAGIGLVLGMTFDYE